MNEKNRLIIELLREQKGGMTASEIARRLGVTRQAVHKRLKKLIELGIVQKFGRTRNARFVLKDGRTKRVSKFRIVFDPKDVSEDEAFSMISNALNFQKVLNKNAHTAAQYAFTEVFNNALDHSNSRKIEVQVKLDEDRQVAKFRIRDWGVGIFALIADKFGLPNEFESVLWLLPGKTTTIPELHTGEGLFFASKITKTLKIKSHRLCLTYLDYGEDAFVEKLRIYTEGTSVEFEVLFNMKKKLDDVFNFYAPADYDYQFEKSRVIIKVLSGRLISRSQAKRIVRPLGGKFREVIIDFKKVEAIGQGFADELLRVFPSRFPSIKIILTNVPEHIYPILSHASSDKTRVQFV